MRQFRKLNRENILNKECFPPKIRITHRNFAGKKQVIAMDQAVFQYNFGNYPGREFRG